MKIDSITLPKKQGVVGLLGRRDEVETASDFQSANDNQSGTIAVEIQRHDRGKEIQPRADGLLHSSGRVENRKRGRPSTRPWHKRRRMGRKAVTKVIADPVVEAMLDGARYAGVIKAPLNTFVTIRPANIDEVPPQDRSAFWQSELNRIQAFIRHYGGAPTYIWARESRPGDGGAEHLHVLVHLPRSLMETFRASLERRYRDPGEVDVRPASELATRAPNGKLLSAVTYLTKALSPQARRKANQPYRKSGPVVGKRAGMTRNIDVSAVAAHRASLNRAAA